MSNCDYCHRPLRKTFVTGLSYGGAVRFYHKVCAVRKDQVECEDCGKLFDYHEGHSDMEWDTGAISWYCPQCYSDEVYDYPTAEDIASEAAWEAMMRGEGA